MLFACSVYDDDQEWFRSIFVNSTKEDAIRNQYEFFVQRMGGPPLYSQRKGNFNLSNLGVLGDLSMCLFILPRLVLGDAATLPCILSLLARGRNAISVSGLNIPHVSTLSFSPPLDTPRQLNASGSFVY
jgi:hypothetical protein